MTWGRPLEQYDRVWAIFAPQRTDDLRYGAEDWIGWKGQWVASWVIEDGDYEGQWAMAAWADTLEEHIDLPPFAWAPECDLKDV